MILTGSRARLSLPLLRWCPRPTVFVEPQEADAYRAAHPTVDFVVLDRDDGGFAFLLNSMVEYVLRAGRRYFVFTDDDVTVLRERPSMTGVWATLRGDDAETALVDLLACAERERLGQLAVSFSGQSWGASKPWQEPVGAWGVHITDARAVANVGGYDETLPIFNDWDMSAKLLRAGYRCARTNLVTFVHKMNSHPGGASDLYERRELVAAAAHTLAARYPGAATVKHVEAHGLDEVRFNWRKVATMDRQR